jgi:hypothetical protein
MPGYSDLFITQGHNASLASSPRRATVSSVLVERRDEERRDVFSFPRGRWERQFPPPSPFLVATYFTFISALFGTLLIRIGVFNSVHSFASLEVVVTGLIFLVLILGHLGPGRPGR